MKQSHISIKWKIYLYLLGFCFLLLSILWLFQIVLLDGFYKVIKINEIQRESQVIAGYIVEGDWEALMDIVSHRGDLYVEVWSPRKGATLQAGNYIEGVKIQMTLGEKEALMLEADAAGGQLIHRYHSSEALGNRSGECILYARMMEQGGEPVILMVSSNVTPVNATVDTLRVQLFVISCVMLVLSAVLAFLIANRVSSPIEKLNSAAKNLGKGNYRVELRKSGYQEIMELANTLDEASKELAKTDKLRQELIANVSHDLRTPLTLITGYGEMMRDLPGENTPENLQLVIDECKRLTSLVNDLLDLSKLQSGAKKLEIRTFNITQELRQIIERFSKLSEQEGCTVTFTSDEDVFVQADVTRVNQVVYNFLINALTHAGRDRSVRVSQIVEGRRVTVQVADTGEGISEEDLPHIWDRYYKVDKVHKRSAAGSGLGLSIVKSILEQHPGVDYGVNSQVGRGSVFWFSLVVAEPPK